MKILKKCLLSISTAITVLPFCTNDSILKTNDVKNNSEWENLLSNENIENIGHNVFNGIGKETISLKENDKKQIEENIIFLLNNDLSFYFNENNNINKTNLSKGISLKIFELYDHEREEIEEQNCGWFWTSHFWIATGWETAVFCSWVVVISLFGISFASDIYSWYTGSGCDFDVISTWNTYDGIHKKTIDGALNFKKETNCDWNYHW